MAKKKEEVAEEIEEAEEVIAPETLEEKAAKMVGNEVEVQGHLHKVVSASVVKVNEKEYIEVLNGQGVTFYV